MDLIPLDNQISTILKVLEKYNKGHTTTPFTPASSASPSATP
jgi:hypothetical protein